MQWKLLILGFLLHVVLFYSIFDIYFTSPIIHGVPHHSNSLPPPAKRLVLFSADGLRADKLLENFNPGNVSHTPYLRSLIGKEGRWGVSHTRVPTESRPGHVAMIAGFYEDVSAVAKGWKENPVEFDSVFNQSTSTLAWGSPDILPMFAKGSTGGHVVTHMYSEEDEDFADSNLTELDLWVFDRVEEYLKELSSNESLQRQLKTSEGLIFFLHLLGLDTTGHVHKPYSKQYVENMEVVDSGVERVVRVMEEFFEHDGKTSYIFTSDHGMTDWGSHGAGHPSETQTPFLAWGAGVTSHVDRLDIQQADICVLMSILLGLPISLQSVGIVPVDLLNSGDDFKAHSVVTNAKQLYEQYKAKMLEKEECTFSWFFSLYEQHQYIEEELSRVQEMLSRDEFQTVISGSRELMEAILKGFRYYHNYERTQLGLCVCLSYIAWMLYVATLLLQHTGGEAPTADHEHLSNRNQELYNDSQEHPSNSLQQPPSSTFHHLLPQHHQHFLHQQQQQHPRQHRHPRQLQRRLNQLFLLFSFVVILALHVQSRPFMHFVYFLFPLYLCYLVVTRVRVLVAVWREASRRPASVFIFVVFVLLFLEAMIFSFEHRQLMTLLILAMALWALVTHQRLFSLCCLLSSIFPLLPTVGKTSNYMLVYSSCIVATVCFGVAVWRCARVSKTLPHLLLFQLFLIPFSGFLVWWFEKERSQSDSSSSSSSFLPFLNMHLFSWCILASSFVLPLFSSSRLPVRMLSLCMSLCAPHLLLCIAYEGLFYVVLCGLLSSWLLMETGKGWKSLLEEDFGEGVNWLEGGMDWGKGGWMGGREAVGEKRHRSLELQDTRRACFYLFFILFSFFGTGNIASVNSFDPTSILTFVSLFSPFVMAALCLFKVLVLLLLASCFFQAIQASTDVPPHNFFLLFLIISDFMACHFFFMVRDSGSWLEIGTSISHYVIIMSFIIFFFILFTLSKFLTHTRLDLKTCLESGRSAVVWLRYQMHKNFIDKRK